MAYMEVEIDLESFDDDELLTEIEQRGYFVSPQTASLNEDLEQIYILRRLGKPYDHLMDSYIHKTLGKVI